MTLPALNIDCWITLAGACNVCDRDGTLNVSGIGWYNGRARNVLETSWRKDRVRMIRYEMVLGIDLIDCLASYDEGLSGDI